MQDVFIVKFKKTRYINAHFHNKIKEILTILNFIMNMALNFVVLI